MGVLLRGLIVSTPDPDSSNPSSAVTLRDVAEVVGVSHVTVSLALRNNPKIPAPRRLQIKKVAREMGYRANAIATGLSHYKQDAKERPRESMLAWLNMWPEPAQLRNDPKSDCYWIGARKAAEDCNYSLEEFRGEGLSIPELEKQLLDRGVNGIILPPHLATPDWSGFHWAHFSTIRLGRSVKIPRVHVVAGDEVENAIFAVKKMVDLGYQRIGFMTSKTAALEGASMVGVIAAHLRIKGKTPRAPLIVAEGDPDQSRAAGARWLKSLKPDAILTDLPGARAFLESIDCQIPQKIGLALLSVVEGDRESGIHQNLAEIGRVAFSVLLSQLRDQARGEPEICRQILVGGDWVEGTTLPRRRKKI